MPEVGGIEAEIKINLIPYKHISESCYSFF